jgi:hypothetical protein
MEPNPLYVLLVLPALLILIITVGISGSIRARDERIKQLREKVMALPLNEKTRERRLKEFDDICQRVINYNTKIRLLEKLASGKKVSSKRVLKERKRSSSFSYGNNFGCSLHYSGECFPCEEDYYKVPISGIASRIILGHY